MLKVNHITHIINITDGVVSSAGNAVKELQIKALDTENQNLISVFVPTIKFIVEAFENQGRVLVYS